jgi:hypothetical protein
MEVLQFLLKTIIGTYRQLIGNLIPVQVPNMTIVVKNIFLGLGKTFVSRTSAADPVLYCIIPWGRNQGSGSGIIFVRIPGLGSGFFYDNILQFFQ